MKQIILFLGVLFMISCQKTFETPDTQPPLVDSTLPILTTSPIISITKTTALSGGVITSQGISAVLTRGVCLSLTSTPTIADIKFENGSGIGSYSVNISALQSGKSYYARAYATNSQGTGYGNTLNFTTSVVDSLLVLSKVGDFQFFYSGDTLPSKVYSPLSDTSYLYYNSQKQLQRFVKKKTDGKNPGILVYQSNLISKIFYKSKVDILDPRYNDINYETTINMTDVENYDSLVYSNGRLAEKYHFVHSGYIGDTFKLRYYQKIYRQPSNQDLLARVDYYVNYQNTGNWVVVDKVDYWTFDSGQINPLYKTLKEIGYLSDYIYARSLPSPGSNTYENEALNFLNKYPVKSVYVDFYGPSSQQYILFDFTNTYSFGNLITCHSAYAFGKTITYQYTKVPY